MATPTALQEGINKHGWISDKPSTSKIWKTTGNIDKLWMNCNNESGTLFIAFFLIFLYFTLFLYPLPTRHNDATTIGDTKHERTRQCNRKRQCPPVIMQTWLTMRCNHQDNSEWMTRTSRYHGKPRDLCEIAMMITGCLEGMQAHDNKCTDSTYLGMAKCKGRGAHRIEQEHLEWNDNHYHT